MNWPRIRGINNTWFSCASGFIKDPCLVGVLLVGVHVLSKTNVHSTIVIAARLVRIEYFHQSCRSSGHHLTTSQNYNRRTLNPSCFIAQIDDFSCLALSIATTAVGVPFL